jgi:hypothetical protein
MTVAAEQSLVELLMLRAGELSPPAREQLCRELVKKLDGARRRERIATEALRGLF